MNEPLILTDVDDTVLVFTDAFEHWAKARGLETFGRLRDIYHLEVFLRLPLTRCLELLEEFVESGALLAQPVEACAIEVLPRLRRQGYAFVAVTACGTDPAFRERRWETLEAAFGFSWREVHTVPMTGSKADVLAAYPPSVWVEDHPGHAAAGAALGHESFLVERPYNRDASPAGVVRVPDWFAIEKALAGR